MSTCARCQAPLRADLVTARLAVQRGTPPPALERCLNGHSIRRDPVERLGDKPGVRPLPPVPPSRPCAVCGKPLPRDGKASRFANMGTRCRKYHAGACQRFVGKERARAHRDGRLFELERQPWYRGPDPELRPTAPPDYTMGPRSWWQGWATSYGSAHSRRPS